jgi:hypothetical protein
MIRLINGFIFFIDKQMNAEIEIYLFQFMLIRFVFLLKKLPKYLVTPVTKLVTYKYVKTPHFRNSAVDDN